MNPDHLDALTIQLAAVTSRRGILTVVGVGAAGIAASTLDPSDARGKKRNKRRNHRSRAKQRKRGRRRVNSLSGLEASGETNGKTFAGTVDVVEFAKSGGSIVAIGELTGEITNSAGDVLDEISQTVELPVEIPALDAGVTLQCDPLTLVIPEITIDVQGVPVVIGPFEIQITSEILGGTLGDLLCALLAGGDVSAALIAFLNQILEMLGEETPE